VTFPAQLLDLSVWKLTLPIGSKGSPTEVKQPQLATYSNPLWFRAIADIGVSFAAPVNGVTTSGSSNPRSELREMNPDGSNASWSSTDGKTHTMVIDQTIRQLPNPRSDGGQAAVVCGQIHNDSDDISVFRVELGKVYVTKGNDTHYAVADDNYVLGTRFKAMFVAANGTVTAYYNGQKVASFAAKFSGAYFKAGAYVQANSSNSNPPNATNYGEVVAFSVAVAHGAPIPVPGPNPVPVPVPTPTNNVLVLTQQSDGTWKLTQTGR
jgi:hypothetical protein